MEDLEVGCA